MLSILLDETTAESRLYVEESGLKNFDVELRGTYKWT